MSRSDTGGEQPTGQIPIQIGGDTVYIEIEEEIAQMFNRIQDSVDGTNTLEQALVNFLQQYRPKIEEQFQTAIFNEYQQVRLQQKVNRNGQVQLSEDGDGEDITPEDTTSPNRL